MAHMRICCGAHIHTLATQSIMNNAQSGANALSDDSVDSIFHLSPHSSTHDTPNNADSDSKSKEQAYQQQPPLTTVLVGWYCRSKTGDARHTVLLSIVSSIKYHLPLLSNPYHRNTQNTHAKAREERKHSTDTSRPQN